MGQKRKTALGGSVPTVFVGDCRSLVGLSTRNLGTRLLRQGLVERFVLSGLKWHFEFLVFSEERGKLWQLGINLSQQGRQPTTNLITC